ncbi:MAG: helix-turn-helix transcriptional regulator [Clostridia bacterium]
MKYDRNRFVYVLGEEYFFAENLKMLRYSRTPKISQKEISRKLGVSRSTYAKYESGVRVPPAWFALSAANYYHIDLDDILSKSMQKEGLD